MPWDGTALRASLADHLAAPHRRIPEAARELLASLGDLVRDGAARLPSQPGFLERRWRGPRRNPAHPLRFSNPVGRGDRYFVSDVYGLRGDRGRHHNGVDLAAEEGTPIRAAAPGEVIAVNFESSGYGHFIELQHAGGWRSLYAHALAIHKQVGEEVRSGEIIAAVGSTGRSTGPHLHFEIRDPTDAPRDPALFVPGLLEKTQRALAGDPRS